MSVSLSITEHLKVTQIDHQFHKKERYIHLRNN
jgi:hypothetical protein